MSMRWTGSNELALLVILDDMGCGGAATPWAEEKLFQILDYRYNDLAYPPVITSLHIRGSDENHPEKTAIEALA